MLTSPEDRLPGMKHYKPRPKRKKSWF